MKTFFKMVNYMTDVYHKDFKENLDLDLFYDDVGIVVHKDYRGLSIAGEIFKARFVINIFALVLQLNPQNIKKH